MWLNMAVHRSLRHQRWSYQRVARELENFVACRDVWPTYAEFRAAGLKRLHAEMGRYGGAASWAADLGFLLHHRAGGLEWDEQRVREELRRVLRQLRPAFWPRGDAIQALGPRGLTRAMNRLGGPARWSEELGVPLRG
jgi:hypothetical protein